GGQSGESVLVARQTVLLDLAMQGRARDVEQAGGGGDVPGRAFEGAGDPLSLDRVGGGALTVRGRLLRDEGWQVLGPDLAVVDEGDNVAHGVAQLADVAGPEMGGKTGPRRRGQADAGAAAMRFLHQDGFDDVHAVAALAQRREREGGTVEPEIEIL